MRLSRRPALLAGCLTAASLVAVASGPATLTAASSGPVLGPSGLPAVQKTYQAGLGPGESESPYLAPPEAVIADRDSVGDQLAYHQQAQSLPVTSAGLRWKNVGPYGIDSPPGYPTSTVRFSRSAGMGATVAVDPRDPQARTVYIGNMGGLWKSTDSGTTWRHLGEEFARAAVGAVAVDPTNPDIVYAGTGIALLTVSGDTAGAGVYVSKDGGRHFTRPAANVKGYGTNAITVTENGTVYVGTTKGLWRSTNHGASFTSVPLPTNSAHTAPAVGAYANWVSALVAHPARAEEVTAAVGMGYGKRLGPDGKPLSPGNGLYRTTSASGSFAFLPGTTQFQSNNPQASSDAIGRIALSYGAKEGDEYVLWALVSDAGLANKVSPAGSDLVGSTTGQGLNPTNTVLNGAFRSADDGDSWVLKGNYETMQAAVNDSLPVFAVLGYGVGVQGFYNLWIAGDPKDPAQVYLGLEEVFQSTGNAGDTPGLATFEVIQRYWDLCGSTTYFDNITEGVPCPDGTPKYSGVSTHPDQHVGIAVPTTAGVRLYTGNDGGFFRQDSHALPEGRTGFDNNEWAAMNTLATTQAWHVARKPDGEVLVANQDNGAGFLKPGGQEILVSSGDGVTTAATSDPDVWYSGAQGLILYVTKNHGQDITQIKPDVTAAGFLSPFAIDPTDENHLVAAAQDVKESLKGPNTVVLQDPASGTVVQSDWTQSYDAGTSPYKNGTTALKWTSQALAVRGAAIYSGLCALCRNSLGDPKLINTTVATNVKPGCTAKKGSTDCWHTAKGKGLPHVAIWSMAIDPADVRTLYVTLNENSLIGLDKKVVGSPRVMVSHDAGESFTDLTGNLPGSNARDVVIRDNRLVVATDNGVFTGPMTGKTWSRLATGLPQVRIFDLDLDKTGRYLTVSAYGRGVWVLDFQAPARTSSSGPGKNGATVVTGPGGRLAATGLPVGLPAAALGVLLVGLLLRRRRRSA